jgi:hypothetical protein
MNSGTWKVGGYSNTRIKDIQNIVSGNRNTNWISGGGDWNCRAKCRYKTTSFYVNWEYVIVVGETYV